jgi:hypothetical protein
MLVIKLFSFGFKECFIIIPYNYVSTQYRVQESYVGECAVLKIL